MGIGRAERPRKANSLGYQSSTRNGEKQFSLETTGLVKNVVSEGVNSKPTTSSRLLIT